MTLKSKIGRVVIPLAPFNRRTFNIMRHELSALRTRWLSRVSPWRLAKLHYIRRLDHLRVNIGSGGQAPNGWIELDIRRHQSGNIPWDIRYGLPFSDDSVQYIYASHVLEHMDYGSDAPRLLKDCVRCLQPEGRIRIVVPDARKFIQAYLCEDGTGWSAVGMKDLPDDMPTSMCMVNHVFHQGGEHQFGYDYETVVHLLMASGFTHVISSDYRSSDFFDPELDLSCHQHYSLYVEAWC